MPTGPSRVGQPLSHWRRLVSREVVEHHVDLQVVGHVKIDQLEEGKHVFSGVALASVVENLAGGHVHRREQVGGAVAAVVMGHRPAPPFLHGKRRLGAIER
jgi:hypothetical protein